MDSNKFTPKFLGIAFLFVAITSALSGLLLSSLKISITGSPNSIAETMTAISENPTTMKIGVVVMLLEAIGIVLLAVLLYSNLKIQNKIIARWAFGLWTIEAVSLTIRTIATFFLLYISQEFVNTGDSNSSYYQSLGNLFYVSTQISYSVLMVFYCLGGILFYYLFLKSKYLPKVIPIWGLIAASLGFIGTWFELFDYNVPLYFFLPILPFELTIGVWLIVKGFNPCITLSEATKTDY